MLALPHLTTRFGAGVTFSATETRNTSMLNDLGLIEPTTAVQGISTGEFSLDGTFSADTSSWLQYVFYNEPAEINGTTTLTSADGATAIVDATGEIQGTNTANTIGYVNNGTAVTSMPMAAGIFKGYKTLITANTGMVIQTYAIDRTQAANSFDIGRYQINSTTDRGGANQATVYTGCYIDSFSISYTNGDDASVKFSVSGKYCRAFNQLDSSATPYDYAGVLADPPEEVFITGCMAKATEADTFDAIAFTDSAELQISNNLVAIPDCAKITYGYYARGNISYAISTSTYSNNATKYIAELYGYDNWSAGADVYQAQLEPYAIPYMRIRSKNTVAEVTPTRFVDIQMYKCYINSLSHSFDVGSEITDSPDIAAKHTFLAIGYIPKV